jgi:carboxymethylenebutenolidase
MSNAETHVEIPVEAGNLPLTVTRARGDGAAVVIMPSAFGVAPDLEAQMRELAETASAVVALDPFFRNDPGSIPYEDMGRVMARLQALDRAQSHRDLRAAIEWTRRELGAKRVVVLGICFGGPFALVAAADGIADAVVTWHGTRMEHHLERAAEMRCPMHFHFGAIDPFVSAEAVEVVRKTFSGREDVRIVVHDGATHGFSHRGSAHAYNQPAEEAGLESVRALVSSFN